MSRFTLLSGTSGLALLLSAPLALAELSAVDVWEDWKGFLDDYGYTVSGVEQLTTNGIEVDNTVFTAPLPDGIGSATLRLGTIEFADLDDGSVQVIMEEDWLIDVDLTPPDEESVSFTMRYTQTELDFVVSGDVGDLLYDISSETLELTLEDLKVDDVAVGPEVFDANLTLTGLEGQTRVTGEDLRAYEQTLRADGMSYLVNAIDPDGNEGSIRVNGTVADVVFDAAGDVPTIDDASDLNALLGAGFAMSGDYQFGPSSVEAMFAAPDGSGTINSQSAGGTFDVSVSSAGVSYATEVADLVVQALFTQFPLPVTFEAATYGGAITMPVRRGDEAQVFGLGLTLGDFSMSDVIWGLFDPSAQLPRDPATLIVDMTGTAKVFFDLLDPEQAELIGQTGAAPGALETLDINNLTLDVAGARLTGSGDFTFDNTDLETFDGIPRPSGALDLELLGGNGLLDKLVSIGLLPENQASGARLMMGLFARPGDAPDSLVSKIEINDQGHVLANGQRIQ